MIKNKYAVINVVGLCQRLVEKLPSVRGLADRGHMSAIKPVFPALTCSAQSTYLTGLPPNQHGIVGNGWYFKDLSQVWLWRQSNRLVTGEKIWETARKRFPPFTCANLFWWYNMYSSVDYSITPRPIYRSDGLKMPDIYTEPSDLREQLQADLGQFPLFNFWGPTSNIRSSRWIAQSAKRVFEKYQPDLNLIYLPHLDYCMQKEGPDGKGVDQELSLIDEVIGDLIDYFHTREVGVIILSEYGITPVRAGIPINRRLREKGWLRVRDEYGEDHFDAGASRAFAVSDHQVAHVYVRDQEDLSQVRREVEKLDGVDQVLDRREQQPYNINHERSGDLVAISHSDRWFSYKYWLDPKKAPDYARTVDIHRKPGYDPVELFVDPSIKAPRLRAAWILLKKKLGYRYLMDLIALDESLVCGSHGRIPEDSSYYPVLVSDRSDLSIDPQVNGTLVKDLLLRHIFH